MIGGVILDLSAGMKHVACTLVDPFEARTAFRAHVARGISGLAEKKFPRHVLVVDDEPLIRWSIAESLADLGLDVEQASDAASALRTVTTTANPFEVVVLDLRLPDMADLSLLATLRQLLPAARLILTTAFGTPDIVQQATRLGATVLSKPFELADLNRVVVAADLS